LTPVSTTRGASAHAPGSAPRRDVFHDDDPRLLPLLERTGLLAVELEAAALFAIAAEHGVEAGCLLTVSDELHTGRHWTAGERAAELATATPIALAALCEEGSP
jgi:purine-nucleoside phosphorylase